MQLYLIIVIIIVQRILVLVLDIILILGIIMNPAMYMTLPLVAYPPLGHP